MEQFETLLLAHTEITNDEMAELEKTFQRFASEHKGSLVTFDKWGKYRLAYPVKKNDYGVYMLARYKVPHHRIGELNKALDFFLKVKCSDFVMRHVCVKIPHDAPSLYKRPEPVDAGGPAQVDSFIKQNKMEGILSTKVKHQTQGYTKQQGYPRQKGKRSFGSTTQQKNVHQKDTYQKDAKKSSS